MAAGTGGCDQQDIAFVAKGRSQFSPGKRLQKYFTGGLTQIVTGAHRMAVGTGICD